jgi:hypothetical protein
MYEHYFFAYYRDEIYLNIHNLVLRGLGRTTKSEGLETLPVQVILNPDQCSVFKLGKVDENGLENTKVKGLSQPKLLLNTSKSLYGTEGKTMNLFSHYFG